MELKVKEILEQSRKQEQAIERKARRWCVASIESMDYEGVWVEDRNTPAKIYENKESQVRVDQFKQKLTQTQLRRLVIREENPGISFREIAKIEKTNIRAIVETFEQIKIKYKKFFKTPHQNGL